jgi:thiosulfate dehydrogenase [quinone] large subunit
MKSTVTTRKNETIRSPKWLSFMVNNPLAGLIWLPIRVWLGYQWITASLHKMESAAWMQGGTALKGFWTAAVAIPAQGSAPIHYAWYRNFLQYMLDTQAYVWFAKLIAIGEMLVGITLILGIFTAFAAFVGGTMNFSFMLAGSASVNPVFLLISVGLILAWKVAGYFGADYFLIPAVANLLGTKERKVETIPVKLPEGAKA